MFILFTEIRFFRRGKDFLSKSSHKGHNIIFTIYNISFIIWKLNVKQLDSILLFLLHSKHLCKAFNRYFCVFKRKCRILTSFITCFKIIRQFFTFVTASFINFSRFLLFILNCLHFVLVLLWTLKFVREIIEKWI